MELNYARDYLSIPVVTVSGSGMRTIRDRELVHTRRMWMARGGALLLPISLFWFGWTSYRSVYWIVPIIASSFFGAGIYIVILSILNYVVDSYQTYSASVLAGVILVRNVVGAGFPLFAAQMYEKLDYEWASSLLGFIRSSSQRPSTVYWRWSEPPPQDRVPRV
jgi:hypothetical protein